MIPSSAQVPIVWQEGVYKVRDTTVTVDSVIASAKEGKTPEQVAEEIAPLNSQDIHSVLAWYHTHQASVDAYLNRKVPSDPYDLYGDYVHFP